MDSNVRPAHLGRTSDDTEMRYMDQSNVREPSKQPQKRCSTCSAKSNSKGIDVSRRDSENRGTCGLKSLPYVYALGGIEARFSNRSMEMEYHQAAKMSKPVDLDRRQTFYNVLSLPKNRYLARKLSWVLTIQGVPIYILLPTGPEDLDGLLEAIRPQWGPLDRQVVVGRRGPIAQPDMCGLEVPMVLIDQIYQFKHGEFMRSIQREAAAGERFRDAADDMSRRMMQIADNTGSTDKHRALNYLSVRCPEIYTKAAEEMQRDFSLTSVEARDSRIRGSRKIVSVVFSFTNKNGTAERYFVRVDTTEQFPFLVTKMAPFYDR